MSDEKDDKWEMPKPVFRSSTGSLPRSLEETISHSFMPNAETIEIDEDDDILSIMDTPYKGQPVNLSEELDHEKTIEIEPDLAMETEAGSESDAVTDEESPSVDADRKPIVVTAKYADERTAASSESNLFFYILIALIVAGIIAAVIYYQPSTE